MKVASRDNPWGDVVQKTNTFDLNSITSSTTRSYVCMVNDQRGCDKLTLEITVTFVMPLCGGTCGADVRELSVLRR